jgi:hypothetical protein
MMPWRYTNRTGEVIMKRIAGLTLHCFLLMAAASYAATYYVDATNGSDQTGDGSLASPWKTIQMAADSMTGTDIAGGEPTPTSGACGFAHAT